MFDDRPKQGWGFCQDLGSTMVTTQTTTDNNNTNYCTIKIELSLLYTHRNSEILRAWEASATLLRL
jgi:hypothetical protein